MRQLPDTTPDSGDDVGDDFGSEIAYDEALEETLRNVETAAAVADIEDCLALSPFEQFRRSGHLSVSDLVGTVWCEVQYDYRLRTLPFLPVDRRPTVITSTKGAEIKVDKAKVEGKERILRRGDEIHKRLEREIHPDTVVVKTRTREDAWGLRLLNMLASLEALLTVGKCREMPVAGFVGDVFVVGIIDEITRESIAQPDEMPPGSQRQSSLTDYFGGPRARTHRLLVCDNKTRAAGTLPQEKDTQSGRFQVMVYKELVDALLAPREVNDAPEKRPVLPTGNTSGLWWLFSQLGLDTDAPFTDKFIEDTRPVIFGNDLRWGTGETRTLGDFVPVWERYVQALGLGTPAANGGKDGDGVTDDKLQLVYRRAAGKRRERKGGDRRKRRKGKGKSRQKSESGSDTPPPASAIADLQRALQASLAGHQAGLTGHRAGHSYEEDLQRAIQLSLAESQMSVGGEGDASGSGAPAVSEEAVVAAESQMSVDEAAVASNSTPSGVSEATGSAESQMSVDSEPPASVVAAPGVSDAATAPSPSATETEATPEPSTRAPNGVEVSPGGSAADEAQCSQAIPIDADDGYDSDTRLAIKLSLQDVSSSHTPTPTEPKTRARPSSNYATATDSELEREEDMLAWAVELSLPTQPEPSSEEIPLRLSQPEPPAQSQSQSSQSPSRHKTPATPSKAPAAAIDRESEKSGSVIGTHTFTHDRGKLAAHLESVLGYWKGERPPRGVAPHEASRCAWCEFEDGCEWRAAKAQEHQMRYFASRTNSLANM